MEAALASVVGGHVACPVIAVPTSVGYGASFGGIAALLGMLNSCAANVSVVNIDAGFKAGYIAGMIARRRCWLTLRVKFLRIFSSRPPAALPILAGDDRQAAAIWRLADYGRQQRIAACRSNSTCRLTMLAVLAVASGLVGCSAFQERLTPQLKSELAARTDPVVQPAAKYVVEIRPDKGKPQAVEKDLTDPIHVQAALEKPAP